MESSIGERISKLARTAVTEIPGLLALVMTASLWAYAAADIAVYDETLYLTNGLNTPEQGWPSFVWGPVYSDLYFALSLAVKDPVNLYFGGRAMAAVIFVLLIWMAARLHVNRKWAWMAGATAAAAPVAYIWPGVGGPAGGALVLAVALLFRWPSAMSIGWVAALIWFAAGSRPEFVYLAFAVSAWAVTWVISYLFRGPQTRAARATAATSGLAALIVPAMLIATHGSPFVGGERSWVAFAQHYSAIKSQPGVNAVYETGTVMDKDFRGVDSILGAFLTNPLAVLQHVRSNAVSLPGALKDQIFAPGALHDLLLFSTSLVVLIVLVSVALTSLVRHREIATDVRTFRTSGRLAAFAAPLVLLLLVACWSLVPLLVIYPRAHYLTALTGLAIVAAAGFLGRYFTPPGRVWIAQLPVALVFVAFAGQVVLATANRISNPPPVMTASVRAAQADGVARPFLTMDDGAGLTIYAPLLKRIDTQVPPLGSTFQDLLTNNKVRAVMVTDALDFGPWASLNGYQAFIDDPARYGFHQAAPDSPLWLR